MGITAIAQIYYGAKDNLGQLPPRNPVIPVPGINPHRSNVWSGRIWSEQVYLLFIFIWIEKINYTLNINLNSLF